MGAHLSELAADALDRHPELVDLVEPSTFDAQKYKNQFVVTIVMLGVRIAIAFLIKIPSNPNSRVMYDSGLANRRSTNTVVNLKLVRDTAIDDIIKKLADSPEQVRYATKLFVLWSLAERGSEEEKKIEEEAAKKMGGMENTTDICFNSLAALPFAKFDKIAVPKDQLETKTNLEMEREKAQRVR